MNPQDDPEARIRALEPTELGAEQPAQYHHGTGYDAPPLPPPTQQWNYQNPYGADPYQSGYPAPYPSTSPDSGFRPWMLIVPMAIVLLLCAGGAIAFWHYTSNSTATETSGGGGVLADDTPAVEQPSLPQLPPIVVDPGVPDAPSDSPAEAGSTIVITGIGSNRTVACADNVLIISGADNTIEVTGHCTAITVSGVENSVTAESAGEITVSGFENRVTYRSGSPVVSQSGSGNAIEQG